MKEVNDELEVVADISPKTKLKPKKRDTTAKEDSFEIEDSSRPLRSSRAKVVNYYAPQQEEELPKIPKASKPRISKKKELEMERGIFFKFIVVVRCTLC